MKIKFGPSGLGPVKEASSNLENYNRLGLKACEIAFTYGPYIKKKEDMEEIRRVAEKNGIELTIHGPYWINLNSKDEEKIRKSEERILECCRIGTELGAKRVVFHAGFYGKKKEETYENIKKEILFLQKKIKEKKYTSELAPEIMGKINVFGSIEEIGKLVDETGCSFCIDFAHILARYGDYNFEKVFEKFGNHKKLHIHFSGIVYGEKGEKHHKKTTEKEWEELISHLPKDKEIVIINESPFPVEDSILGLKIFKKINKNLD